MTKYSVQNASDIGLILNMDYGLQYEMQIQYALYIQKSVYRYKAAIEENKIKEIKEIGDNERKKIQETGDNKTKKDVRQIQAEKGNDILEYISVLHNNRLEYNPNNPYYIEIIMRQLDIKDETLAHEIAKFVVRNLVTLNEKTITMQSMRILNNFPTSPDVEQKLKMAIDIIRQYHSQKDKAIIDQMEYLQQMQLSTKVEEFNQMQPKLKAKKQ